MHQELQAGVADPLAHAEAGAVDALDADRRGPERGWQCQPAIVVAVPVQLDAGRAHGGELAAGEGDQLLHAVGGDVAGGVAEAEAAGALVHGGLEEGAEGGGVRSRGVLRHQAEAEAALHRGARGVADVVGDELQAPALDLVADGRAAHERVDLDREARPIRGAGDALHVGDHGARRRRGDERQARARISRQRWSVSSA